ncbi:hypothetical protein DV736_g6020, partial [Chaetothyriales sp. CBS 134916]
MAEEERRFRQRRTYRSGSSGLSEDTDDRRPHHRHRDRNFVESASPNRQRSQSRDTPRKRRTRSRGYDDTKREKQDLRAREQQRRDRKGDRDFDDHRHRRRQRGYSNDRALTRRSRSPEPFKRSKGPLPSQKDAFQNTDLAATEHDSSSGKQKPNYGNTGRLAAASNTVQKAGQSIVLKYHEPPEARTPSGEARWRMYVFKSDEIVDTVELAEQSYWLFGREAAVVDILLEHPSTSKQHAVIQFRYIEKKNEFGDRKARVKPYILDLESANGTTVNDDLIPEAKYVELRDKDVVKFGRSSREYVMQLPPAE